MRATYARNFRSNTARVVIHPATRTYHEARESWGAKLAIATSSGMHYVRHDAITYCKAEGNYCAIMLRDGKKLLVSKTLKWVSGQLPDKMFVRVHASYLVSIQGVSMLEHEHVRLEDGSRIPVARSRKSAVRATLATTDTGRH